MGPGGRPIARSRGVRPLAGCGTESHGLALDLRGGASSPKVAQNLTPSSQARQRKYFAPPPGTPHKPQPAARFRKSGKRRFPGFRREADALHKRREAKQSRKMPPTQEDTANRPKSLSPTTRHRQPPQIPAGSVVSPPPAGRGNTEDYPGGLDNPIPLLANPADSWYTKKSPFW